MPGFTDRVEKLAHEREVSESRILEEAMEQGVKEMWEQSILSKYLRDEINRNDAIDVVGIEKVRRAEKDAKAVEEDVEWGATA